MGVFEALVLLSLGLLCGIVSTLFDVLVVGSASFLSHFALWVLLNTLLATHVESRAKAIWWAVPFNLGFIEAYFITTVASYESYAKSLVVPLAAVALLSPLLANALWSAKREKGPFGQGLSIMVVVGTLISSFVINGTLSVYDWVVSALVALYLLVIPTRRLRITPARRVETVPMPEAEEEEESVVPERIERPKRTRAEKRAERAEKREQATEAPQPTKRTGKARGGERKISLPFGARKSRDEADKDAGERPRSRRARTRRERPEQREEYAEVSTLGNVRSVRPSSRSRR